MSDVEPTSNQLSRAEPIEQEIAHPFAVGDMVTHYMGGGTWRVIDINSFDPFKEYGDD